MRRAQQLGRYHLLDRIAFGGMAEIYRAKTFDSNGHAHLVAVKRVLAHLAEDDDFIQMLVDEAKIAGLLKHANIARVYEFARAHGEYFIAMEHVDGKDLRTIMERCRQHQRPMPPQHVAWIGGEISAALHAAHTAVDRSGRPLRIVHRDVSPSNVICAYTGEVKLCDFGIAKATLSKVNTKTGVIKGKVKYMSPEQALGRKLDHRSDIFSLGSCLYEMLTRAPPFTATNEMDLLIKVRDARYRPLSELAPGVPPELETITDRCLARSRANRYQTTHEVRQALRGFLKKFMPKYSRSYLGRYVRKMFTAEIERELRILEEYVVSENVSEDVGENLIAEELGPRAAYTNFTPNPGSTAAAHKAGTSNTGGTTDVQDEEATVDDDFDERAPQHLSNATTISRGQRNKMPAGKRGPAGSSSFDIHASETLILDRNRDERLASETDTPDVETKNGKGRQVANRDDFDEALHNAPTLILDHDGGRRGGRR